MIKPLRNSIDIKLKIFKFNVNYNMILYYLIKMHKKSTDIDIKLKNYNIEKYHIKESNHTYDNYYIRVARSLTNELTKYRDIIMPLMFKLYDGEEKTCIDKSAIEDTIINFAEHYNKVYTEFEDIKVSFPDRKVASDIHSIANTIYSTLHTNVTMINFDKQKRLSELKIQKFTQLFIDDENIFDENMRIASVPERLNLIKNKIFKVRTLMTQKKSEYHFENINHIEMIDTFHTADSMFVSMVLNKYLSDALSFIDHTIEHDDGNFETFKKIYQNFTTYMALNKKFDAREITLAEFESFHFDLDEFLKQLIKVNDITNELFGWISQI